MRRSIVTLLVLLSFGLKAQVYQAMPQAGYGPVKRMLFDSVLTIPLNINQLRNITGGRDAGQIRYNVTDSGLYVFSGFQWIKANLDSTNISNRINGKLNISDTAAMLLPYMKFIDTVSLSNRINLRVKYSDTAQMLSVYLRKLDTASLSRRIDKKQDSIILTTNFKSGAATLNGANLNIPKYSDTLNDAYVPYVGANKDVDLGVYDLTGTFLTANAGVEIQDNGAGIGDKVGYTSLYTSNEAFNFRTSRLLPNNLTKSRQATFLYPVEGDGYLTTFNYNLPVRTGTLALVEDTVNLSNRINLKADKATTLTINGVTYNLSANRTWTIPVFDSTSISNRIDLKLNISDTASMLSPYLRKADTSSLSNRIDLRVKYSDTAAMLSPYLKSAVTSVGLSMPSAFSVANSPITSTGTIAVTGAGTAAQYIRGDGVLATYNPGSGGGGSSQVFYFNGGVASGVAGYQEMSKVANTGAAADFSINANGYIASFLTGAGVPNQVSIPSGNWNFEIYMSSSSAGGSPSFYVELYKYNGTTFTLIASSSANPEYITNGTAIDLYTTALSVPTTTLLSTDRLAVRVYVTHSSKTITMHTQNSHLSEVITTFTTGLSSLNGLIANTQYFSTGTSGSDFNISSVTDTHTFNLPTASSTKRGALSSADWSTFNGKMNYSDTVSLSNRINTKLNSSDTISLSNRINTKLNATDTASLSNRINAKADALSGTTNTVPKFTSSTTIGNSNIKDNGNVVTINATAGSFGALQVGSYNGNILMNTTNANGGLIFQNTSSSNKLWDFSSDNNDLVFNESNIAPVMKLKAGGNVVISNLSGTGSRMVVADANGVLSTQAITGVDTTSLSNRINLKLNISDTASMLSGYQSAINSKQAQINGTGFVKASGTTISYDNSTYYLASNPNGYTSNTGTVTSVASGLGLSGGTITTSGTLLVDTASASILSRQRAANTYATTSSLSGYLPLTGGTLTGALGGTSASFSDNIQSSSFFRSNTPTTNSITIGVSANTNYGYIGNSNYWGIRTGTTGDFNIDVNNSASPINAFKIASTGAATFSSSITSGSTASSYTTLNSNSLAAFNAGTPSNLYFNYTGGDIDFAGSRTVIKANGSLGIGATSPTQKLTVIGSETGTQITTNPIAKFVNTGNSFSKLIVGSDNTNYDGVISMDNNATLANTKLRFYIGNGTSSTSGHSNDQIVLQGNGNVGIGTASPGRKLDVNGVTRSNAFDINYNSLTSGFLLSETQWTGIAGANNVSLVAEGGVSGGGNITFFTNGSTTERMRITSGGSVGIGNTNPFGLASSLVAISGSGSTYNLLNIQETVNASNAAYVQFMNSGGSTIGSITRVGTTNAVLFNTSSDIRLKKDLGVANENIIDSVVIHDFEWLQNSLVDKGVFAQELYKIKPLAVSVGKDEVNKDGELLKPWGVDYSKLIPDLIIYCQDLKKTIKELQLEIQTLKNK